VKQLRAALFELLEDGQLQLRGIGHATEPSDLRRQFQRLRDEALIFAIEKETDLA